MASEHIYIVEDDPHHSETLQIILEARGYKVTHFPTVDAAFAHMGWDGGTFTCNLPDAVITDNDTGYESRNGLELIAALKDTNVARILCTGSNIKPAQVIAAGGPQAKVIYKPLVEDRALSTLRAALDSRGMAR